MDNLEIDYKKAAQQLRSGEALFGKDGALAPLLERILNSALEGEMDAHLSEEERSSGNRRNGKMVYHHYSVPTILQVVTRICFRKKLFYYRF